jgi:SSS family solute:Na+ symporter
MRTADLVVFIGYLVSLIFIGALFYKRSRSSSSYVVGDNKIPAWVISLSLFATFVSSISYLALPGSAFQANWNPFVFSLSLPIAAIMAVKYFVPLYRKVNSPSAYTFLANRFGSWARTYASSMYLMTQVMRVGAIVYLLALATNMQFGWSIPMVIIITSLVVMIYSVLGGIQAVIWTDAVQAMLLIGGALYCVVIMVADMPGGMTGIFSAGSEAGKFSLGSLSPDLSQPTFWVVLVYGIFINLQNFGADQNYIQRYLTSKSLKEAQWSAFWGALLYIPVSMVFLFIGTSLWVLYQSDALELANELVQTPDKVFPHFIVNNLPVGATGLLMASLFAAGMSTMSTSYNSSATIILTDFFLQRRSLTESQKMFVLYASTAIVGIIGMLIGIIMINTKSALDTWWKFASIFSGGVLGLFLLGAFTKIESRFSAAIAVTAGLMVIILMTYASFVPGSMPFLEQFHPYLATVFGTTTIFIVGFALGRVAHRGVG